jgi:6-phosphogluconate dehydrogenase
MLPFLWQIRAEVFIGKDPKRRKFCIDKSQQQPKCHWTSLIAFNSLCHMAVITACLWDRHCSRCWETEGKEGKNMSTLKKLPLQQGNMEAR